MVNNRKTYFAIYYQLHRDKILKRSIEYYENNKLFTKTFVILELFDKKMKFKQHFCVFTNELSLWLTSWRCLNEVSLVK
jgi:hypothetical protein